MSNESPGPSNAVQLALKSRKSRSIDLRRCIICKNVKDIKGSTKLTSTEDGRLVILKTSKKLKDGLVGDLDPDQLRNIKYHVKTCYSTYRKKGERFKEFGSQSLNVEAVETCNISPVTSPPSRPKRSKIIQSPDPKDKACIICNHVKRQGNSVRYRIGSVNVANNLIKAANFNKDDVYTRMVR